MAQITRVTAVFLLTLLFVTLLEALSFEHKLPNHITWIEDLTLVDSEQAGRIGETPRVDIVFTVHGETERIKLQLFRNEEILSNLEYVHYLRSDGSLSSVKPIQRSQHSIFKGNVLTENAGRNSWTQVGAARISILKGGGDDSLVEGTFTIGHEVFYIKTDSTFRRIYPGHHLSNKRWTKPFMIVWKDGSDDDAVSFKNQRRDGLDDDLQCGLNSAELHHSGFFSSRDIQPRHRSLAGYSQGNFEARGDKGQDLQSTIGSTNGCPTTRLIALLGVATDCGYTADFGSLDEVEANIITEINSASQIYEDTFNISLAIRNLTISDANCPSSSSSSSSDWNLPCSNTANTRTRLSRFSEWRGQINDNNAVWTLLTGCRTDSTVGISWLGQVCQKGSNSFTGSNGLQTSASTNIIVRNIRESQVIAHEIGHSFGAVHDCTSDTCAEHLEDSQECCPLNRTTCDANGQFIMNPASGAGITKFSPCSIGAICAALGRGTIRSDCLRGNANVAVISTPSCATGPSGTAGCDFTAPIRQPTEDPGPDDIGDTTSSRSWLDRNKNIIIIVTSVVGSFIIFLIAGYLIFRVRQKRRARMVKIEEDRAVERSMQMAQSYRYM
ncbi:Metallo-peptidase family M12-domain-containing protein [Mariannaea sp. PMI_226]|nr:Metallo-peptidase family M12-domain-containing protein [Mariannaea sp. PMI_226]